jgi:hypothetical protein
MKLIKMDSAIYIKWRPSENEPVKPPADPKQSTRRFGALKGLTGFIGVKSHTPAERNSDIVSVPFGNLGGFGPAWSAGRDTRLSQ